MKLSKSTIRIKKRFVGDLSSFKVRHGMTDKEVAKIIGANWKTTNNWMCGHSFPWVKAINTYRKNMRDFDVKMQGEKWPLRYDKERPISIKNTFSTKEAFTVSMRGLNMDITRAVPLEKALKVLGILLQD